MTVEGNVGEGRDVEGEEEQKETDLAYSCWCIILRD